MKTPTFKVGDSVQWTSQEADRFPPEGKKVTGWDWKDGEEFVFVEGTDTGIPASDLKLVAPAAPAPAKVPARPAPAAARSGSPAREVPKKPKLTGWESLIGIVGIVFMVISLFLWPSSLLMAVGVIFIMIPISIFAFVASTPAPGKKRLAYVAFALAAFITLVLWFASLSGSNSFRNVMGKVGEASPVTVAPVRASFTSVPTRTCAQYLAAEGKQDTAYVVVLTRADRRREIAVHTCNRICHWEDPALVKRTEAYRGYDGIDIFELKDGVDSTSFRVSIMPSEKEI